uniref:Uncharacterized protein n=1 Tax=Lepeophtheirus salmonis TaxID=72036 RepID=A0A0K2U4Z6_LEPSM
MFSYVSFPFKFDGALKN